MLDLARLERAYQRARADLLAERTPEGHWVGELSSSALSTATAVSALSLLRPHQSLAEQPRFTDLIEAGLRWIYDRQNADGGWGDTDKSVSNISTTMLVRAATHLAGPADHYREPLRHAEQYIDQLGGIPGLRRRYGKDKTFAVPILTNYALAGLVPWSEVSPLPFEAACLPQSWYRFARLPVVSYAIPALVAIGQARYFKQPPRNPVMRLLRRWAIEPSLRVLSKMQPASGGYLEATPLTSFVVMSLAGTGRHDHPVTRLGQKFLLDSVRPDGSWPIDTNLATWVTTLAINALAAKRRVGRVREAHQISGGKSVASAADAGPVDIDSLAQRGPRGLDPPYEQEDQEHLTPQLLEWLLGCQHTERHPFTGAAPGGWGWSDLSGAVPDADDTPGALLALQRYVAPDEKVSDEVEPVRGAEQSSRDWLLGLQNRDGGWPTFCRGWGVLPFDRSGTDLTAHALRSIEPWTDSPELRVARQRGLAYLARTQRPDGSWLPLWFGNQARTDDENPLYGTSRVLFAYRDLRLMPTEPAQRAVQFLLAEQNDDGGWGGGPVLERGVAVGPERSSVEETALVVEALLADESNPAAQASAVKGLSWLVEAVESNQHQVPSPIGFYFAKLWYYEKLYPIIFTVSALGHALACLQPPASPRAELTHPH